MGYMPFPFLPPARIEKHRLFIAFPVFLAALGVSVLAGAQAALVVPEPVTDGTVLTVGSQPETDVLADTIVARLLPGSIVIRDSHQPVLSSGEGVFAAPDHFMVSAGGLTIESWNGAVRIIRSADSLVVDALTTPALISGSGGTVLVPVHRTWTAPATLHSQEQGMQRWVTERTTQELTPDQLRTWLPVADSLLKGKKVDASVVDGLATTSTGWLLAAFHPQTRDLAWTYPQPQGMTKEQFLLSIVSFLPADILSEAYADVAFDRWSQAFQDFRSADGNVSIVSTVQEQAKAFSMDDVPERANRALSFKF